MSECRIHGRHSGKVCGYCALGNRIKDLTVHAENQELKAKLKAAEAKLEAARKQLISCHRFACTFNSCMLDGGPEHEAAFIEEQTE